MKLKNLEALYVEQLQDMHSAERQLVAALPKMVKAASHPGLAAAFKSHLEQTKHHVVSVAGILEGMGKKAGGKKCKAMEGLVKEGSEIIAEDAEEEVRDAGLICAAQKIEHYEIATYGCLRTFAALLGRVKESTLLQKLLDEEKTADEALTSLATAAINSQAMSPPMDAEPRPKRAAAPRPKGASGASSAKKTVPPKSKPASRGKT